jgi:muconolactone delta-isomerase
MKDYMVDINLPDHFEENFIQLIPQQRAYVYRMMQKGTIRNYSLSADRQKLWVIINASSLNEVRQIIYSFPIFNFIRFRIHNLLIHDSGNLVPQLWLN